MKNKEWEMKFDRFGAVDLWHLSRLRSPEAERSLGSFEGKWPEQLSLASKPDTASRITPQQEFWALYTDWNGPVATQYFCAIKCDTQQMTDLYLSWQSI